MSATYNREILHKLIDMIHIAYRAGVKVSAVFDKVRNDLGVNEVKYLTPPTGFVDDVRTYAGSKGTIIPSSVTDILKKRGILQALSALFHIGNASGIDNVRVYDTLQELWFPVADVSGLEGADDELSAAMALVATPAALAAAEEAARVSSAAVAAIGATRRAIPTVEEAQAEFDRLADIGVKLRDGTTARARDRIEFAMSKISPAYNPSEEHSLSAILGRGRPLSAPDKLTAEAYISVLSDTGNRARYTNKPVNDLLDAALVLLKAHLRPQAGGRRRTRRRRATKTHRRQH
jgi:hypothetical protein